MAVEFNYTDDELSTINVPSVISEFTGIQKIEWCSVYSIKASHRQVNLVELYLAGVVGTGILGYDIDLPQATIDAMRDEVGDLSDRIEYAQSVIQGILS